LRRVRDGEREETHARPIGRDAGDDGLAAAVRQMHVEQDDVGVELLDQRHGVEDSASLADDVDPVAELVADAREEEGVVVDEHDARLHDRLGRTSSTSVPLPGADVTVAAPPARAMRASIDSERPRRSPATAPRSKPTPRSRTNTLMRASSASA